MRASIIIRTFNEEKHLGELLEHIGAQNKGGFTTETIIVDSGSTDATLDIARKHSARVLHVAKEEFSFGRSLNVGCEAAEGDYLVFVSGHCVPATDDWLKNLVGPLCNEQVAYTYGRQIGNGNSKFSECRLFEKYYPETDKIPQEGYFVNNANAALCREAWAQHRFNETLTGLEDMELGQRLCRTGKKLAYVSSAAVFHLHDESWESVRRRYEREAIALQHIMPQVHITIRDFFRYLSSAMLYDMSSAVQVGCLARKLPEIFMFRLMQFWGAYRGNHEHRVLSREMKEKYFYPHPTMRKGRLGNATDTEVSSDRGREVHR